MVVSEIELFEVLSQQLGAEKAKSLVQYVEAKVDKRLEDKTSVFSTKEDIAKLETKIAESKAELLKWMIILFAPFYVGMIVFLVKQFS
jgi:hypothetical protein